MVPCRIIKPSKGIGYAWGIGIAILYRNEEAGLVGVGESRCVLGREQ